jgi:putative salt-induced outer membrane protein YdiY
MIEWRRVRHTLIMLAIALAGVTDAAAQSAAIADPPGDPAAPPPPAWHGSLSLGLSTASGVQAQRSIQLQGSLARPFARGGRFVANLAHDYQRVTFPADTPLADRTNISIGEDEEPTPHTVIIARTMYLRDSVMQIDSRFEQMAGYGLHLHDKDARAIDLQLVPGLSVHKEDLAYADPEGWKAAYGFYERFSARFNKVWSVENTFRFRHDFTDAQRSIESAATVEGTMTKVLGVQIQYQYNYESIVPPDYPNYLSMLVFGLKFKF